MEFTDCDLELFEEMWKLYPRKKGKSATKRIYTRLLTKHDHKELCESVKNFAEDNEGKEEMFIPHGNSFFIKYYEDYLPLNYKRKVKLSPVVNTYKISGYDEYLKLMMAMPYPDYINTEHWIHFREEALKFFGVHCGLCNSEKKKIQLHHKTYKNRGRETFNDVIPLCEDCHKKMHGI